MAMNISPSRIFLLVVTMMVTLATIGPADAAPIFARKYKLTCVACHAAFPKLNAFGQQFMDNNYRLPNWKETTVPTGDDLLALPDSVPIAIRAQAYVQSRDANTITDLSTGATTSAANDIQAPYLIKLISSAPLSDHMSYYFYGIMAEKGTNGSTLIEDAWISHDDVFGSGTHMMLGQFQVSDLMFPRETRLTFQDYMAYRMAGITYDRGVVFSHPLGPMDLSLGLVNGNGIEANSTINSAGYRRPDHLFDDNADKAVFGRLGFGLGPVDSGLFFYNGQQKNVIAPDTSGSTDTPKNVMGLDLSGQAGKTYWFMQYLINRWDGFITPGKMYEWPAAFLGIDYIASDHWTYSLLYNYADGSAFDATDTVYEGINMNAVTLTASYYFMRNVKGIIELNVDMLSKQAQTGSFYTGHLTTENYILFGFDAAF
jgi:hypothetical protein